MTTLGIVESVAIATAGAILAAAPTLEMQQGGASLLGAAIGGFVCAAGWRDQEKPVTLRRFLVNAGCGMCFGVPLTRAACAQLALDPDFWNLLMGGFLAGVFGVGILDVGPTAILEWIKGRFPPKS